MAEMKTFNGYEVVDAKARQNIANIHTPTKVSELENDKGYLTEHQSLEGKADKEHTHPQYLTEHQSLDNYYTKAQTDSAIGEAVSGIKIPEPDLTPYAKVADMPTKVSQLENDANYLTEHQSLDEYAKKTDIPVIPEIPSLDNVATKEYVDTADKKHTQDIANLTHHIQNIIEPTIVQKSDKGHKHTISEITDYTAPDLSGYAKKSDIPSLDGYATEQYVDTAITNAPCKFEVIDIQGADSEKVPVQAGSDVLERIIAGEKFPFYLYKKDGAGRDTFILPDSFTPIGSSTILMSRISYNNIEGNVALYNMNYTFSKTDSIWNVRLTNTEVK